MVCRAGKESGILALVRWTGSHARWRRQTLVVVCHLDGLSGRRRVVVLPLSRPLSLARATDQLSAQPTSTLFSLPFLQAMVRPFNDPAPAQPSTGADLTALTHDPRCRASPASGSASSPQAKARRSTWPRWPGRATGLARRRGRCSRSASTRGKSDLTALAVVGRGLLELTLVESA